MRRNLTYRSLLYTGKDDWYLPSKTELDAMYTNLYAQGIGDFNLVSYWSSSENDNDDAWNQNFFGGVQSAYTKAGVGAVRACRSFTDVTGAYSLRDEGPAGGLVFYVDDNVFKDWFLPSKDLLAAMYTNLHAKGVGGFSDVNYLSSSENNATTMCIQNFVDGDQGTDWKDAAGEYTRACRSFTATAGDYSLRDTGPAGGLICYIDGTTFYEAASSDLDQSIWSNIDDTEIGATAQGTAIGTGQANTTAIIAQAGHVTSAAKLCSDLSISDITYYEAALGDQSAAYTWSNVTNIEIGATAQGTGIGDGEANTIAIIGQSGGTDDWFLPSKDELNAMYTELYLEGVGGFTNFQYWSSTEYSSIYARYQIFSSGRQFFAPKYYGYYVRACRSFTADIGAYSLRDVGPGGGLIFHIDGTTFYEAAPSDQSTHIYWSNVNKEIGVTAQGTGIGDGEVNTEAIIGQDEHTNSAAKLCDDLDNPYAHTDSAAKLCSDLVT